MEISTKKVKLTTENANSTQPQDVFKIMLRSSKELGKAQSAKKALAKSPIVTRTGSRGLGLTLKRKREIFEDIKKEFGTFPRLLNETIEDEDSHPPAASDVLFDQIEEEFSSLGLHNAPCGLLIQENHFAQSTSVASHSPNNNPSGQSVSASNPSHDTNHHPSGQSVSASNPSHNVNYNPSGQGVSASNPSHDTNHNPSGQSVSASNPSHNTNLNPSGQNISMASPSLNADPNPSRQSVPVSVISHDSNHHSQFVQPVAPTTRTIENIHPAVNRSSFFGPNPSAFISNGALDRMRIFDPSLPNNLEDTERPQLSLGTVPSLHYSSPFSAYRSMDSNRLVSQQNASGQGSVLNNHPPNSNQRRGSDYAADAQINILSRQDNVLDSESVRTSRFSLAPNTGNLYSDYDTNDVNEPNNANEDPVYEVTRVYKLYDYDFKVSFIQAYLKHGLSLACMLKKVDISTASKWVKKYKDKGYEGLHDQRCKNGAKPFIDLEKYVFQKFVEYRTKGLPINYKTLQNLALTAPKTLIPLNFVASLGWIQGFNKRHNIVRRKKTHQATEFISQISDKILLFYDQLQEIHSWQDKSIVFLNLDETPIFMDLSSDYTLNAQGAHEVKVISHTNAKTRCTFTPCVSSEGDSLPPLFVFIYKYSEVSNRDFPIKYEGLRNQTSPFMIRFTSSGSNNENILIEYITKVIKPWKDSKNVNPVLVLDEATCHYTPAVISALKSCNILPLFVPGGATSLVQPLDVSLNKPLKASIRRKYSEWLEDQSKKMQPSVIPPSIEEILKWCQHGLGLLSRVAISNSFKHTGISEELAEMRDLNKLHSKLNNLFDEYCVKIGEKRQIIDDFVNVYADPVDKELYGLCLEQELDFLNEGNLNGSA